MKNTIKNKAEIEKLFNVGRRFNSRHLTLIVLKFNNDGRGHDGRVAFIAGKKLGNAPQRNRAKRIMRHIANELNIGDVTDEGYKIVFLAKKGILKEDYEKVKVSTRSLIESVKECGEL